jgi:hypothetical protein
MFRVIPPDIIPSNNIIILPYIRTLFLLREIYESEIYKLIRDYIANGLIKE